MLRFSLYAMTQPKQFPIFPAEILPALTVWRRPRRRQGQALRVALRRLRASLDPSSGRRVEGNHRAQGGGNGCGGGWGRG